MNDLTTRPLKEKPPAWVIQLTEALLAEFHINYDAGWGEIDPTEVAKEELATFIWNKYQDLTGKFDAIP